MLSSAILPVQSLNIVSRTTRLLTLLQVLRGKKRPVMAATLAAELEVSKRTLYRDIAELTALGAPIHLPRQSGATALHVSIERTGENRPTGYFPVIGVAYCRA